MAVSLSGIINGVHESMRAGCSSQMAWPAHLMAVGGVPVLVCLVGGWCDLQSKFDVTRGVIRLCVDMLDRL